jgi:hypothetical protein
MWLSSLLSNAQLESQPAKHVRTGVREPLIQCDTDVHRAGLLEASGNAAVSEAPALLRVPVGVLNNKMNPRYRTQRKA